MKWAMVDGQRSLATPGLVGACPGCGGEVVAKCGEVLQWHWAHRASECDPWSEPESEWHIAWKNRFPAEWQERVMCNHRADVLTPRGVIEFQKSSISTKEIREREQFYGQMVWVIDASQFNLECDFEWHERAHRRIEPPPPAGDLCARFTMPPEEYEAYEAPRVAYDCRQKDYVSKAFSKEPHYRWLWPRKSWLAAKKTLLLDRGLDELLQVKWISGTGRFVTCNRIAKERFVELVSTPAGSSAPPPPT